jgi:hypothetical protein
MLNMYRNVAYCTPRFPYRHSTTLGAKFWPPTTGTGCTTKSGIKLFSQHSNETVPMKVRTPVISSAWRPPTESTGTLIYGKQAQ